MSTILKTISKSVFSYQSVKLVGAAYISALFLCGSKGVIETYRESQEQENKTYANSYFVVNGVYTTDLESHLDLYYGKVKD